MQKRPINWEAKKTKFAMQLTKFAIVQVLDNFDESVVGHNLWEEYKLQRRIEFAFEVPGFRYFDLLLRDGVNQKVKQPLMS